LSNLENPSKYCDNALNYIERVLNAESWSATSGRWNNVLERQFAKTIGMKHGIAMNSGTATMHAALEAIDLKPGEEVISPALTVIMNTTSTLHANGVPVYADVDPDTFNIDPKDIERKITSKTRAIMTVGLYGQSPDMDPIMSLAEKHNLVVIEDNAQCFMNTYKGLKAGSIGHFSSYSFENTKHLSSGEGGILLTNNEKWAEKARKVGGHGFKNLRADEGRVKLNADLFQNPDYKRHDMVGWNYRLNEFSAAIALAQLERGEELVRLRKQSAQLFLDVMSETDFLLPQKPLEGTDNSYYTLGVIYKGDESIGISWHEFRKAYIEAGGDGIYGAWSVPYLEPVISERSFVSRYPEIYTDIEYGPGLCPVAEKLQKRLMQFKTNYRSYELAERKADILRKTIRSLQG